MSGNKRKQITMNITLPTQEFLPHIANSRGKQNSNSKDSQLWQSFASSNLPNKPLLTDWVSISFVSLRGQVQSNDAKFEKQWTLSTPHPHFAVGWDHELSIVNHRDCRFKCQNWSWNAKATRGQREYFSLFLKPSFKSLWLC